VGCIIQHERLLHDGASETTTGYGLSTPELTRMEAGVRGRACGNSVSFGGDWVRGELESRT